MKGFVNRLVSSTGGDLDFVTQIHLDLRPGRVTIRARVDKDVTRRNPVADIFKAHRAMDVSFLDWRSIETLA